jgi:hypothetical protein
VGLAAGLTDPLARYLLEFNHLKTSRSLFNKYPNGNNSQLLALERANLDNAAVSVYPSFSPFGINGGDCYARLGYRF